MSMRPLPNRDPMSYMAYVWLLVFFSCSNQDYDSLREAISEDVGPTENQGTKGPNTTPEAVVEVSISSGEVPLEVSFDASKSSGSAAMGYRWDFKDGSSSYSSDPVHIFTEPGQYDVQLTIMDKGLQDSTIITITVKQVEGNIAASSPRIPCGHGGGKADGSGAKIWCWESVAVPSAEFEGNTGFSNGELALNVECSANQVTRAANRLKFRLDPNHPEPAEWCNNDYNMRAEIRTLPWPVNQPLGTEEWIGWSYSFGDGYIIDRENPWLFFQMHQGIAGSPPLELAIVPSTLYSAEDGEIVVINHANRTETDRTRTGVVPIAGTTLDIVVHVIHDLGSKGLLEIWIDGTKVYDKRVGTVYKSAPWGGNAKFGIYKWPWRNSAGVQKSLRQGITDLETFMGSLRIVTWRPGHRDYRINSYLEVMP